jgi:hypothetical protein
MVSRIPTDYGCDGNDTYLASGEPEESPFMHRGKWSSDSGCE